MARPVLLDNVSHKGLRIITRRSAAMGDNVSHALTFPAEFRELQSTYPIVFHRDADGGQYHPIALLGLEPGENLFLTAAGWDAAYIPVSIERLPFLIGTQGRAAPGAEPELVVHVDLDSPRVSQTEGEALFLEHGGPSPYLERASSLLSQLHLGLRETPAFAAALQQHELLESFVLDVALAGGAQARLSGFHTIDEDRLRALDAPALGALHAQGFLEPIYMVLASTAHLRDLVDRRRRRSG
jgi:hypothetical protein